MLFFLVNNKSHNPYLELVIRLPPSRSAHLVDEVHDLIVHNQHDRRPSTTENVSEGALEESLRALRLQDLREAVRHAVVHLLAGGEKGKRRPRQLFSEDAGLSVRPAPRP